MSTFYWFVWAAGIIILFIVFTLYKLEKIDTYTWHLFWLGFLLGMCWEFPMSIANELAISTAYSYAPATFITPTPIQGPLVVIIIAVTHSLWDGGIFLIGVLFVKLLCQEPYFEKFNWKQLFVLIIFGQIQELIVELTSTFSEAWVYNSYWWNPTLFLFNGHNITVLGQLIWLGAPIIFYLIALKMNKKHREEK